MCDIRKRFQESFGETSEDKPLDIDSTSQPRAASGVLPLGSGPQGSKYRRTSQPAQNKPIAMVQGKKPSLTCCKSVHRIVCRMATDSEEEMGMFMLALLLSKRDRKVIKKRAE